MQKKKHLRRNEDNKIKGLSLIGGEQTQNKGGKGRKNNKMKERQEDLGSCVGQSNENSDFG